jgi:hypothetical protein
MYSHDDDRDEPEDRYEDDRDNDRDGEDGPTPFFEDGDNLLWL